MYFETDQMNCFQSFIGRIDKNVFKIVLLLSKSCIEIGEFIYLFLKGNIKRNRCIFSIKHM